MEVKKILEIILNLRLICVWKLISPVKFVFKKESV